MYVVHDFLCENCDLVEERFLRREDIEHQHCNQCGMPVVRQPCAPKVDWDALARGDNASPEAIRHFDRKRRQRAAQETKTYREHGDYGKAAGS